MGATTTEGTGPGAVQIVPLQIVENKITVTNTNLESRISALESGTEVPAPVYLSDANNGDTLGMTANLYFADLGFSDQVSVNLPDPTLMTGRTLVFVGSFVDSESFLSLAGFINGNNTTYNINNGAIIRFISDGTSWWAG